MNSKTNPANNFTAQVYVDKEAALLAGRDHFGSVDIQFKPSELSETHRKTLLSVNYKITRSDTGAPITGAETLEALLDAVKANYDKKAEIESQELSAAVQFVTNRLKTAPAADDLTIDAEGLVKVTSKPDSLIKISMGSVTKEYRQANFYDTWGPGIYRTDHRRNQLREIINADPEILKLFDELDAVADGITERLKAAQATRDAIREANYQEQAKAQLSRTAQIKQFVIDYMGELAIDRYNDGLMQEAEILEAMTAKTFNEIDQHFTPVDRAAFLAEAVDFCCDCVHETGWSGRIIERDLETVTDDQYKRLHELRTLTKFLRDFEPITVKPFLLTGYLDNFADDDDPEYRTVAALVTVMRGDIELSREYSLNSVEGAE
ncbi:hypothetical protein GO003_014750 [Methylicorpusculum oleiharenae]|uniref:hypothetical protein n=1 Tax=Methylicorpusculum oleiharenae TaxID=1338687 RepID=UPI001356CC9E|nr:hypothetical protein [Methylicorpusculum oleiharenae]MCD2451652.1 hypothetical protein [Methylicorpusculum oleiharenae]